MCYPRDSPSLIVFPSPLIAFLLSIMSFAVPLPSFSSFRSAPVRSTGGEDLFSSFLFLICFFRPLDTFFSFFLAQSVFPPLRNSSCHSQCLAFPSSQFFERDPAALSDFSLFFFLRALYSWEPKPRLLANLSDFPFPNSPTPSLTPLLPEIQKWFLFLNYSSSVQRFRPELLCRPAAVVSRWGLPFLSPLFGDFSPFSWPSPFFSAVPLPLSID